jgi:phage-related minor tail protein
MPRFATGGIVTGPTVGLVGEAGPEAIIPLDRMGKMGGGNSYTINVSAMNADARVGELIVSAIKKYERTSGSVFVSA